MSKLDNISVSVSDHPETVENNNLPANDAEFISVSPEAWQHFTDQVGAENILPVAQMRPGVTSTLDDSGNTGKVPSIYTNATTIKGYKSWPDGRAKASDVAKWAADSRYGFGVRLGHALPGGGIPICIDVDTECTEHQETVERLIREALAVANPKSVKRLAMRVRSNSSRRAYLLCIDDVQQMPKSVFKLGKNASGKSEAVEFLGTGQQFIAAGVHPSGALIEWLDAPADSFTAETAYPDLSADGQRLSLEQFTALQSAIRDALPVISTAQQEMRARSGKTGADVPADAVAIFLDEHGYTLSVGSEGERHIKSPFAAEYTKEQDDGDTSVTYFLPGTRDYQQGHFVSLHASDADRTDADFLDALGVVAAEFDELEPLPVDESAPVAVATINGRAAFLTDAVTAFPFARWNGATGDNRADKTRAEISQLYGLDMRLIAPEIRLKHNNKGELIGYQALNHSANLKWVMYKQGITLARNMMTFEVEAFTTATGEKLTASEAKTRSFLVDQTQKDNVPKDVIADHFEAVTEDYQYHPVARLLADREWDGVPRVQRVLDCVPVSGELVALRDKLLTGVFIAAIAAIDDGRVSLKYAPVLFSEDNDFFKTAFIRRLFDIMPGAFKEGVSVDPSNKDGIRNAAFCWGAELGELDSMTKKESGPLKAWLPQDCDQWRAEHAKTWSKKPRQTVFIGTVNKDDFIKDETVASRFPVIPLVAPILIDEVNAVLGWELVRGAAELKDSEQLAQFWLEVRAIRAAGATHVLDVDSMRAMKAHNDQYIDKGNYYDAIRYRVAAAAAGDNPFAGDDIAAGEWFTPVNVADSLRVGTNYVRPVGKALARLAKDGVLNGKRNKYGMRYTIAQK